MHKETKQRSQKFAFQKNIKYFDRYKVKEDLANRSVKQVTI